MLGGWRMVRGRSSHSPRSASSDARHPSVPLFPRKAQTCNPNPSWCQIQLRQPRHPSRNFRLTRRAELLPGTGKEADSSAPQTARSRSSRGPRRLIDPCPLARSCGSRACGRIEPFSCGSTTAAHTFAGGSSTCRTEPPPRSAFCTEAWRQSALPSINRTNAMSLRHRFCALRRRPPRGRRKPQGTRSESEPPHLLGLRERVKGRSTDRPCERRTVCTADRTPR
jgi:hypothetical protein